MAKKNGLNNSCCESINLKINTTLGLFIFVILPLVLYIFNKIDNKIDKLDDNLRSESRLRSEEIVKTKELIFQLIREVSLVNKDVKFDLYTSDAEYLAKALKLKIVDIETKKEVGIEETFRSPSASRIDIKRGYEISIPTNMKE